MCCWEEAGTKGDRKLVALAKAAELSTGVCGSADGIGLAYIIDSSLQAAKHAQRYRTRFVEKVSLRLARANQVTARV